MVDRIGQFCIQHAALFGVIAFLVFVMMFNRSERKHLEEVRSEAMSKEVDKYDPEDSLGV